MSSSIGQRREQIIIQSSTETHDGEGIAVTWPPEGGATVTTISARAEYLDGRELEGAQKINTAIQLRFTVNYRTDLTEKMRVYWRSEHWNIHAILPAEDKFSMSLMCSKVE